MQMRSFKKMAREKKIKVLTLVIFLCLFGWFRKVKASDLPKLKYMLRDGDNGLEGVCIASEKDVYLGTDWSYPLRGIKENQPSTESYFLPNLTSDFDCNFENGHPCIDTWNSNVWQIPEQDDKKYDTIVDYRWEDLPTYVIDRTTPFTDRRIDIHQNVSITISIRSNDALKILLCEGWLPNKYPCYKIIFGKINGSDVYLINSKNETITSYLYQNPIFSFDRWRSFRISFLPTGGITLKDLHDNVDIINIIDKNPLKVIFLFMESEHLSLWKVHRNNFLYTNLATNTTFGPLIKTTSKNFTICMLVSMCENCVLNFYTKEHEKTINLLTKNKIIGKNWILLRVYIKNYTKDQLQLFTETIGPKNGFWMIDNVRMCSEKELKIIVLKNSENGNLNMSDNEISCHALSMQQWRPTLLKFKDVELPSSINISEFSSSISLSNLNWKPQRIGDEQLPFILKYQGHHLCQQDNNLKNASIERIKSNGMLLVEGNQITINNLIPYTHYSISIIHLINKNLTKEYKLNTQESANITENEIPRNIKLIPYASKVKILRKPPSCHDIFGRLEYKYSIGNKTVLSISENQDYLSLNPFTNYTLKVETSRNFKENFEKVSTSYNFTTQPDVAKMVSSLDLYEITEKSVGLRYKLPKLVNGVPEKVSVTFCSGLLGKKCDSIIENIARCVQYPDMFCVKLNKLITGKTHTFKLSIKNKGTSVFGKEDILRDILTRSNVPGKISNLTYKVTNCSQILEYCNFNISWTHPWMQIGAISAFEIVLIEIDTNKGLNEIYTLTGEYSPTYYHIIHYLPYATIYNISVRAINNKLKGDYVSIIGKIDHIGDHTDQIPNTVNVNEENILIQIPPLDLRIEKAILTVIVQNDILEHIHQELWNIIGDGNLCKDVAETWIAKVVEFSHENKSFLIGDGSSEFSNEYQREIVNKNLLPDNEYCFTYIIHNVYKNISHTKIYHKTERTLPAVLEIQETTPNVVQTIMIVLTVIILLILIALALFRYRHRLNCTRQDGEHIYEGIPFDNYSDVNEVYNSTYDKLIHN